MTQADTSRPPAAPPAEGRRLGLALRTELRLNAGRFATTLVACAAVLFWAVLESDQLSGILTLWAVLAWYRYGRADTEPPAVPRRIQRTMSQGGRPGRPARMPTAR